MTEKKCSRCEIVKSTSEFWKDRSNKTGFRSYCKGCKPDRSEYHRNWAKQNPDKILESNRRSKAKPENKERERWNTLRRLYNLTPEEYFALVEAQGGLCAICKRSPTEMNKGKRFAIDHDHSCCPGKGSCGKCIRGLLCVTCNQALGMFLDSPEILENAINYLRSFALTLQD